jgi:hypothetical protein
MMCQSKSIHLGMTKDDIKYFVHSFYFIEFYATVHSLMYLPKILAMLGIFAYIWYWGGFEKTEEGESTHLQLLEKILEENDFEADNKELP